MTFFKNNNTWLWVIVFIVLIIVVFGMKKSENMTSDCNVCGGFCTCPSCLAHKMDGFDNAFTTNKSEHFSNTVNKQMDTMHKEMNTMDKQMNEMNTEMNKMNKQMDTMSNEMNAKKMTMHDMPMHDMPTHDMPTHDMPTQKSHMNTVEGHTNNIHHVTAAKVTECKEDEIAIPTHKLPFYRREPIHREPIHREPIYPEPIHREPIHHEPMYINKLHEMIKNLSHKAPEILDKCTPGLLQSLMSIAKLIGSTEGKLNKLKSVEPTLTKEFQNLNMLLLKLNKKDMMCLETETRIPLNNMMCEQLDRLDVSELQQHANDLDYVNEMLKSQKQNFRQMRDLFVVRLRDLVNQCDNKDPVKRNLQLHSINTISEILHSLGYIFQDDTLKSQEKLLKSNKAHMLSTDTDKCPDGYELSLNGHACVLPGEKIQPCVPTQIHADGVCRYKLHPDTNPPSGWYINNTYTGIKKY